MSKVLAAIFAAMFALGTVSAFAAADDKKKVAKAKKPAKAKKSAKAKKQAKAKDTDKK